MHTIINGYLGRKYIFPNDNYYSVIDECSFRLAKWVFISDEVPGITQHVDSSFKFTDGKLYIFLNNYVFVFTEFRKELVTTDRNNLSAFGLQCVNQDMG